MKPYLIILAVLLLSEATFAQNWTLIWSDEFDGSSLNLADWNYDLGTGSQYGLTGWGNNELQYYRSQNVSVSNGLMTIEALDDGFAGMDYTSGKIHTKTKQYFTYGKIEARMKVPTAQGMWPAFWMLTEPFDLNQNSGGWPPEIDIMESVGSAPQTTHGTAHWGPAWDQVSSSGGSYTLPNGTLSDDFHVYTIEWYPDNIVWYFDGIQIHEINRTNVHPQEWQFDEPFFLIFNLAVGGNWPGPPDGSTTFPQYLDVDWVRVYDYDESTTTDVTFRVDMSEQTLNGGDVVYVNGTWNSWCGTCNPLTDLGNGIWQATYPIPVGVHEYLYTTNGWGGLVEALPAEAPCALTTYDGPDTYVNRVMNVEFDPLVLQPLCFDDCELCPGFDELGCTDSEAVNFDPTAVVDDGSCQYLVEFQVDMSQESLAPTDVVHLNGTFNAWCGTCAPMSDPDMDDVWTLTIQLGAGSHEYKFTTNGWTGLIEEFEVGEPCTNTTYGGKGEVWTNREIQVTGGAVMIPEVCFNSCTDCPEVFHNVTFRVDMANETLNPNGVHLMGDFQGWDPATDEMLHLGYGLYEYTVSLEEGATIEYLYVNGDNGGEEEIVAGPCTNAGNRTITVPATDSILDLVCFSSCELCDGCSDPFFIDFNPYANSDPSACNNMLVLGCTYTEAENYNPLAQVDDGSCIVNSGTACPGDFNDDNIVNTIDLLIMLGAYGIPCP